MGCAARHSDADLVTSRHPPELSPIPMSRSRLLPLATLCSALCTALPAQMWQGGGSNNNFSSPSNWLGGVPVSGTNATLTFSGVTGSALNDLGADFSLRQIVFNTSAGPFAVGGARLRLDPQLVPFTRPRISTTGNFFAFVDADLVLGEYTEFAGNSYLISRGEVADPDHHGLFVSNTGLTEFAGTYALTDVFLNPGGFLTLSGSGTIRGNLFALFPNTQFNLGGQPDAIRSLEAGSYLAGRFLFSGGTTQFNAAVPIADGSYQLTGGALAGSADITFDFAGAGSEFTFAGGAVLGGSNRKLTVNGGLFQFATGAPKQVGLEFVLNASDIRWTDGVVELLEGGSLTLNGTEAQIRGPGFGLSATGAGAVVRLANNAILRRVANAGAGTTTLNAPLQLDSSSLLVEFGNLALTAGGIYTNGSSIDLVSSSLLEFGGGTHALGNTLLTGAGAVRLSAGVVDAGANAFSFPGATEFTGGVFRSSGDLNVSGPTTWSGTQFDNPTGQTAPRTLLQSSASLTGPAPKRLNRRSLEFLGGGSWQAGDLELTGTSDAPAALAFRSSFSIQSNASVLGDPAFTSVNVASGTTLAKSGPAGTTTVRPAFANFGTVQAASGRILLQGGSPAGSFPTGSWNAVSGAEIEFGGGTFGLGGGNFSGQGTFRLSAGSLARPAGSLAFGSANGATELDGGALTGDGTLTIAGTTRWRGTALASSSPTLTGQVNFSGLTTLETSATKLITQTSVSFLNMTWLDGDLQLFAAPGTQAGLHNGSLIRIDSDRAVLGDPANTFFRNAGSVQKLATSLGTTTIAPTFTNTGVTSVAGGRLLLTGGNEGPASGTWNVSQPGVLEFGGGQHALADSTFSGNGIVRLSAGTVSFLGLSTFGSASGQLQLDGGTLAGLSVVTLPGAVRWRNTLFSAPLGGLPAFSLLGPVVLEGSANKPVEASGLLFGGGVNWTDGDIELRPSPLGNSSIIFNSLALLNSDRTVLADPATGEVIVSSAGTLRKPNATGTTTVEARFVNFGTIDLAAGRLLLNGGSGAMVAAGSWIAASGATVEFGGGTHRLSGGAFSGTGVFRLSAGIIDHADQPLAFGSAAGTNELSGGSLLANATLTLNGTTRWSGTAFTTSGAGSPLVLCNGPTLIEQAGPKLVSQRTLRLLGGGSWNDGDIQLTAPASTSARLILASAVQFQAGRNILGDPANTALVVEAAGTLQQPASFQATNTIGTAFANQGALDLGGGRLLLGGGGGATASAGRYIIARPAVLEFGGGTHALTVASAWSGSGTVRLSAGTIQFTNLFFGSPDGLVEFAGGTFRGAGNASIAAPVTWTGTSLEGTGATSPILYFQAPLTVSGNTAKSLSQFDASLNAGGTWLGGDVALSSPAPDTVATLRLNAAFSIRSDRTLSGPAGSALLVIASGAVARKEFSGGTTTLATCLQNDGTLEAASGTLALTSGCNTNNGTLAARSGGIVRLDGVLNNGTVVAETNGTLIVSPSGVLNAHNISISGLLDLRGGRIGGEGSLLTIEAGGRFTGSGTVDGGFRNDGLVSTTGTLRFTGAGVNNGVLRLRGGGELDLSGTTVPFVNNGILDVITGSIVDPNHVLVNNGLVLDSSVVQVKRTTKSGDVVSLVIEGYDEHVYQLQYSPDLQTAFANAGAPQTGTSAIGSELTFTDANPAGKGFYRVVVNP